MVWPPAASTASTCTAPAPRSGRLAAAAAVKRGFTYVEDPTVDDVIDPFRQDDRVYAQMADELAPAVQTSLDAVAPVPR